LEFGDGYNTDCLYICLASQRRTTTKREELEKGCDTVAASRQQFLYGVLYHLNLNRKENATIMEM
jgi:hypothetical protein